MITHRGKVLSTEQHRVLADVLQNYLDGQYSSLIDYQNACDAVLSNADDCQNGVSPHVEKIPPTR